MMVAGRCCRRIPAGHHHLSACAFALAVVLLTGPVVSAQDTASNEGGLHGSITPGAVSDRASQIDRALRDYDAALTLRQQDPARAKELFRSAAKRIERVADTGIANGRLEYNIANAYLQAGDVGRAILHYRRAERLIPNDPLLRENLSLARSRRLTSIASTTRSHLLRTVFFWHYQTTTAQRATAAVVLYVAAWVLLLIRIRTRRAGLTVGAIAALALAAAGGLSVSLDRWMDRNRPPGVILTMDVPVYRGPGRSYSRQFEEPLQPGVEFTLVERRSGGVGGTTRVDASGARHAWWRIELADGKTGWIESTVAALIPPGESATLGSANVG